MTGVKAIGGARSSGKPSDWSDIKRLKAAGYSHITLFKLRVCIWRMVEEKFANHDASSHTVDKATDKEVLRSHVDRMVEEKLAKRKQIPGNTRPLGGGQGAGAKRKLAQLQKDAAATAPCEHCGKKHAGECWYKPGGKKRIKAEKKALKTVEESADNYSRVSLLPLCSRIPRTCTVLRANLFIANPTRNAYPNTQAEVSVTKTPEHVVSKHSKSANLQGLLGKPQIAQYADLAFRLKTDNGQHITLRLRQPGLFLPEAKEILIAHQDLEDDGFRLNYHTGKVRAPGGHVLTMIKNGSFCNHG
jgi:hypothetical protein